MARIDVISDELAREIIKAADGNIELAIKVVKRSRAFGIPTVGFSECDFEHGESIPMFGQGKG